MKQELIGVDLSARHLKASLNLDTNRTTHTAACIVCNRGLSDEVNLTAKRKDGRIHLFCSEHYDITLDW